MIHFSQVKQDSRDETFATTRARVEVQQELDNMKTFQARLLKEHEQVVSASGVTCIS